MKVLKIIKEIKEKIIKKDKDLVLIFDGDEGSEKSTFAFHSGKLTFAFQIAKYLDPSFNIERVCMDPSEFIHVINKADKGQVVIYVYDEDYGTLSEINNLLVSMMMETRQKNLIVFIVLSTIFLLDKYITLWRAKGLFHIYEKRGRCFWIFYNKREIKCHIQQGQNFL